MANWECIDSNPYTGLRKYIGDHPDDPDGVLVRYEQTAKSIERILDRNRREEAEHSRTSGLSNMEKVAEIPIGVMYEWLVKHGVDFWNPNHREGVRRLLNDPDYRWLKCKNIII